MPRMDPKHGLAMTQDTIDLGNFNGLGTYRYKPLTWLSEEVQNQRSGATKFLGFGFNRQTP